MMNEDDIWQKAIEKADSYVDELIASKEDANFGYASHLIAGFFIMYMMQARHGNPTEAQINGIIDVAKETAKGLVKTLGIPPIARG